MLKILYQASVPAQDNSTEANVLLLSDGQICIEADDGEYWLSEKHVKAIVAALKERTYA